MRVHVLVLNYNGRPLLAQCLPSVVEAARASSHDCDVSVIDNDSTDDSVAWLAERFPQVQVIRRANRGLASFNDVVAAFSGPVAVLLNNDIKLARDAIDSLVAPLLPPQDDPACFMTAPWCRRFDGATHEAAKTAVRWRWGLVQATAFFPGCEAAASTPGLTASAGAALAVSREKFVALGGFDSLYLPGRIEDLDFALRGYLAGYHARYVPEARVFHLGMGTFGKVFGASGCDHLALRNTLLFQWKNLRHPRHILRQAIGMPLRLALDVVRAVVAPKERRWAFTRALVAAIGRVGQSVPSRGCPRGAIARERDFFRQFHPRQVTSGKAGLPSLPVPRARSKTVLVPRSGVHPAQGIAMGGSPSRPTITAAIIAQDEAHHLAELLPRLDWVDEIVVVDGGSRDATRQLAASHGCRVVARPFDSFAAQRNYALGLATGDWVFSIDADERPTPALVAEVLRRITSDRYAAYRIPIRSRLFGRRVRRSGTQDDSPVRLFRRGAARWTGEVHERLRVRGRVGRLDRWLEHYSTPDLATFRAKMERYNTLAVRARVAAGRPPRWLDQFVAPLREIVRRLVWKQGFLDGPAGWAFCLLAGVSEWHLAREHRRLDVEEGEKGRGGEREKGRIGAHHTLPFSPSPLLPFSPPSVLMAGKLNALDAPGGGEVQMLALAEALNEEGVSVRPWRPWEDRLDSADCLHLFGSLPEHLPVVAAAQRQGVPVVLSTIAWFDLASYWREPRPAVRRLAVAAGFVARACVPAIPSWRRRLYHAVDLLLPNSQAEAEQLIRYFAVPPQRISIVPNGADERFGEAEPEPFARLVGLRDFVLCAGRIEPRKNQLGLIRAMRGAGVGLVILGETVPGQEAYAQACRREGDETVRFVGRLDHADPLLASAYAAARCLVLCGWYETPGLAALEAAMSGTPLVLPEAGCAREYFGSDAQYVRPADLAGIRRAVLAAFGQGRSPALAERVRHHFSWRAAARATREAYQQVMRSDAKRRGAGRQPATAPGQIGDLPDVGEKCGLVLSSEQASATEAETTC